MKYIQSFYQYPVTFSSIGRTIPARSAQGETRNIAEFTEAEFEKLQNREPFFRELVSKNKIRVLNKMPTSYVPAATRINQAEDEAEKLRKELEAAKAELEALKSGKATTEESTVTETESKSDDLKNLSYDELKERATANGIEYKANVKKADLIKMIEEAEAKAKAE